MSFISVFDVMGPNMIGPSSSHTAGAARIGFLAQKMINGPLKKVEFTLYGSFSRTYKGHGTDRALLGGIMGFSTDDMRIRNSFEIEFGSSIEEFLDSIYLAGADIGGTKLENYAKSIERSNKMLNLLNSAVDILRSKHKHGEQYYWILYYSYLSPQQLQNTDEIIEKLEPHITNISKRTYYRRRPEAVQALSSILWGYTSKDFLNTLDNFFPNK